MFSISKVLNRVIVFQFYQQNTGLFLFIFFVMFGMVEGSQLVNYHLALMTGIVQSTVFLLLVFCVWLSYSIKSSQFVLTTLARPENSFLFTTASLPRSQQIGYLLLIHSFIHFPVWVYAILTSFVAFKLGSILIGIAILAFNLLLCLIASIVSFKKLNNPTSFHSSLLLRIRFPVKKTLSWFYVAFIANDLKMILVITKLFSYFAVFGFFQIPLDHYETRIPFMGLLIGLTAHAILIFEIRKWEDSYLSFTKNLPIPITNRYLILTFVYALLITPELFLMVTNKVHLLDIIGLIFFGVGFLLFLHSMLYRLSMNMDRYIQYLLITFLLSFALILFTLSWLLIFIYVAVSILWYKKYYYTFESLRL